MLRRFGIAVAIAALFSPLAADTASATAYRYVNTNAPVRICSWKVVEEELGQELTTGAACEPTSNRNLTIIVQDDVFELAVGYTIRAQRAATTSTEDTVNCSSGFCYIGEPISACGKVHLSAGALPPYVRLMVTVDGPADAVNPDVPNRCGTPTKNPGVSGVISVLDGFQ